MLSFKIDQNKAIDILCIGAHCDDIEIGAGGTLLKFLSHYKINTVYWLVFTSNEIRKQEAIISANAFLKNVLHKTIIIETFRDGYLKSDFAAIKDYFEKIKRQFNPDLIFTHYSRDMHQDHRLISELTWNTWRNNLILEYEIPKYDGDLGNPNFYIEIEEKVIAKRNKIILESFISQKNKHWFNEETFNALARLRGVESATTFAEAFYARKITG